MSILLISGTSAHPSNTATFAEAIASTYLNQKPTILTHVSDLPLFNVTHNPAEIESITKWKTAIKESDGVIIITPAYLHNIPASLKSALEWLTHDGELSSKPTLPIVYTPHAPRGEKAMQSLLWSLQALDAKIITSLMLHKAEVGISEEGKLQAETIDMISAAMVLLEDHISG